MSSMDSLMEMKREPFFLNALLLIVMPTLYALYRIILTLIANYIHYDVSRLLKRRL